MKTLFVYTRNECGNCVEAKVFLNELEIPYTEINVDNDYDGLEFLHRNGDKYLPQFYTDDRKFMPGGWNTVRTMRQHEILERLK